MCCKALVTCREQLTLQDALVHFISSHRFQGMQKTGRLTALHCLSHCPRTIFLPYGLGVCIHTCGSTCSWAVILYETFICEKEPTAQKQLQMETVQAPLLCHTTEKTTCWKMSLPPHHFLSCLIHLLLSSQPACAKYGNKTFFCCITPKAVGIFPYNTEPQKFCFLAFDTCSTNYGNICLVKFLAMLSGFSIFSVLCSIGQSSFKHAGLWVCLEKKTTKITNIPISFVNFLINFQRKITNMAIE